MNMGDAMIYCDSLQEGGYDNWVVPTFKELMFVAGGGGILPGTRTSNYLWSSTPTPGYGDQFLLIGLDNGKSVSKDGNDLTGYVRCVRHESISVSGSGSSSGGSSTPSTLGSGMPTMISNESTNKMTWSESIIYCESLSESGYSDWIMPSIDQITYAISGGCVINDARTTELIWTRSINDGTLEAYVVKLSNPTSGDSFETRGTSGYNGPGSGYLVKCRCVR